jgi:arylsulfatase A-like enzyme
MRPWRRIAVAVALLLPIALVLFAIRMRAAPGPDLTRRAGARPFRIVMILIDALRADRLPFYGHEKDRFPYLSRLAREGVVFERAYGASTWTSSSVASIFTGLYPNEHHVLTGYNFTRLSQRGDRPLELNRIPDTARTLPEVMQALGRTTLGAANNPNIGEPMGFARGFERLARRRTLAAEAINGRALRWRERLLRDDDYFLYLHYMDTHHPYQRHDEWFDPTEPNEALARYDSALGYLDAKLAELHDALGWNEDTLLLVLADHGEEFGDHGDHGHHNQLYGELLHVALVFWWPEEIAPGRVTTPVSHVDVLPTLEELASGAPPRTPTSGVSLVPLLDGRSLPDRTLFAIRVTETSNPPLVRKAALRGRFKYITSSRGRPEELYDVVADPRDQRDLIADRPEVAAALRQALAEFEARPRVHQRAYHESEQPAGAMEPRLRALGYVQ